MTVNVNKISDNRPGPAPSIQIAKADSRVYRASEKIWSYAGKSLVVARNLLNGALRTCYWISSSAPSTIGKIQTVITQSKIFSIIGVPFHAVSIAALSGKIGNSFTVNDLEGIFLGILSSSILLLDAVDSLTTSVNAATQTFASTSIQWMSAIGLPIGFGIVGLGSISRGIRLYNLNQFCRSLEQATFMKGTLSPQELRSSLSRFLKENLNLGDKLKETALERHTNRATVELLKDLQASLEQIGDLNDSQADAILKTLRQIDVSLRKEMLVQGCYVTTNILMFTALCLFLLAPPSSAVPFFLLAASWSTRLILQGYQDFIQERLPEKIEWTEQPV